ncbi:unnamed protein product [Paramecium octaurelia]|uniref:Transmembrane protein n=1 Tax=Paramecium octaurelia TaxID=43137 RepID=A0A8S1WK04_PAROT|nr:unnamed protein product [Paramecium octaurelia]
MKALPFSLITLQFFNNSLEEKYQEYISEQKLTCFRMQMSNAIIILLANLFTLIIQQEENYLVIIVTAQILLYALTLIFSRKISPIFKYLFPFLFVMQHIFLIIWALDNLLQPHFVFGFLSGIYSTSLINYLSVKVKTVILLSFIWILLGVFRMYTLMNLNQIFLAFGVFCFQVFFAYLFEYNSRLNFSQGIIIQNQNNILYKFTSQKILILSFSENKTFFKLDFANQKFESIYNIDNNLDNLKEFLRNHFIINLPTHQMTGSLKVQKFANKQITLEDLLFEKYKAKSELVDEINEFQMIDQNKTQSEVQIQIIHGLQTQFVIVIQENKSESQIENYEKKISIINNISANFSMLVGQQLQSIYRQVSDLEIYEIEFQTLNKIQGNMQYLLNESKNQFMFYSFNKLHLLKQEINQCQLSTFIMALKPYFLYQSRKYKREFQLLFQVDKDNVQMKINTKLLTQILINVFNRILTYSKLNSKILLKISKEYNLNPQSISQSQKYRQNSSSSKYDYLCSSQDNIQLLININFIFNRDDEINNFEGCFISQNNEFEQSDDLISMVNSYLLKQISPYNKVFIIQEQTSESLNTTLKLYIYSDQTQIDPSYCASLKQQHIID